MERRGDGGVSSVMRIWKRAAVTGKAGDCCGYDSKCKRGGRGEVAVRRRYDGTPARTGEY